MKGVVVVEFDLENMTSEEFSVLLHNRIEYMNERGVLVDGITSAAVGLDAEMILDVFRKPESGGGQHVVRVVGNGWILEHSLVCRRAGLLNCPITQLVAVAWREGHFEDGDLQVRLDESGTLLWGHAL
jgi:hypothetical protein